MLLKDVILLYKSVHSNESKFLVFFKNLSKKLVKEAVIDSRRRDETIHAYRFYLLSDTIDQIVNIYVPNIPISSE